VKTVKDLKIYCDFITLLSEKFSYIPEYRSLTSTLLNVSVSRIKEWLRIWNSSLKSNSNIVQEAFNNADTTLHDLVNSLKLTSKSQKRRKKSSSKKKGKAYIEQCTENNNNNIIELNISNDNDNVTDNSNQSTEIDQEEEEESLLISNNDKVEINNYYYESYNDDDNFKDNNINIDNIDSTDPVNNNSDYDDDDLLRPFSKRFRDIDFISFTPDLLLGFHEDDSPISERNLFSQIEAESSKFEHIWSDSEHSS
jgi:hypothetical protein